MAVIGAASSNISEDWPITGSKPHLFYILADDFGWADADWHRDDVWPELATPNMHSEVRAGVELDNMYAFKFCAPSRSAIQSGRNPIHVNVQNYQPTVWDSGDAKRDKVSGYAGIPTEMTGIAAVLRGAGYSTHFAGKWDAGMATEEHHTPKARGYDTSLFYFHHDSALPDSSLPLLSSPALPMIAPKMALNRGSSPGVADPSIKQSIEACCLPSAPVTTASVHRAHVTSVVRRRLLDGARARIR